MMAAALLSGCNARNGNIMQIEEQGSFAVGGTVLTDSLGRTYHGDHATCSIRNPSMPGNTRLSSPTAWGSFPRHGKLRRTAARGSRIFSCAAVSRLISSTSPAGETRGGARHPQPLPPSSTRRRVQPFPRGHLARLFRGRAVQPRQGGSEPVFPSDDANSRPSRSGCLRQGVCRTVRQDRSGCLRHPFAGRRCRMAYTAADKEHPCHRRLRAGNKRASVRHDAEEGKVLTLSKKTEGVEVPMEEFLQFTKIPIIIYYGDNLPETDERPELYEWTRRCI